MLAKCVSIELIYLERDLYQEYPRYLYKFTGIEPDSYDDDDIFPLFYEGSIIATTDNLYKINTIYDIGGALYERFV